MLPDSKTVLTLDNVAAIVPNQKLITETVKNWQHGNGVWQLRIAIAAKYGIDARFADQDHRRIRSGEQ